ncbi:hypothetical protein GGF32_009774 [Allomyces javanicus]|nr:hypothetical protein GGF32_009774 [Allomyces javanicus]
MPSILRIRVDCARDLPVMDRSSELADAYVEVRFGDLDPQRSGIARKTLNPVWNHEFRLEVTDDSMLQNDPLEIRVLDYDAITANDAVGAVLLDLDPLVQKSAGGTIAGWFPLYDTLRGIRGEVHVQVRLQFFGDVNPFKESSAGVQFFASQHVPSCYQVQSMKGFVDALICDDDPEYHWSDSFRTPRASNEARQKLLCRLSGQMRRMLGKKALEQGANAILGFRQHFDLENENKVITCRAVGTACLIAPVVVEENVADAESVRPVAASSSVLGGGGNGSLRLTMTPGAPAAEEITDVLASPPLRPLPSPALGHTHHPLTPAAMPGGGYLPSSALTPHHATRRRGAARLAARAWMEQPVQLLTLTAFPGHALVHVGGIVTAKSVKLLGDEETEATRDGWWQELREEVKQHAKALRCAYVVGYTETTTVHNDLMVLSATGTAANLDWSNRVACRAAHVPYPRAPTPFPMGFALCQACKRKQVPQVWLTTVDPPAGLDVEVGVLVEAYVCRPKKRKDGETNAATVSDAIPFTEYDLHRQLLVRLKQLGMNAIFGLKMQLSIGDEFLVAVATGTAFLVPYLPAPARPGIASLAVALSAAARDAGSVAADPGATDDDSSSSDSDDSVVSGFTAANETPATPAAAAAPAPATAQPLIIPNDGDDDGEDQDLVALDLQSRAHMYTTAIPARAMAHLGDTFRHQLVVVVRQGTLNPKANDATAQLAAMFRALYLQVRMQLAFLAPPCILAGVAHEVAVVSPTQVQIKLSAVAMGRVEVMPFLDLRMWRLDAPAAAAANMPGSLASVEAAAVRDREPAETTEPTRVPPMRALVTRALGRHQSSRSSLVSKPRRTSGVLHRGPSGVDLDSDSDKPRASGDRATPTTAHGAPTDATRPSWAPPTAATAPVEITPLPHVPNASITAHLGPVSLHFVKEAAVHPLGSGGPAGTAASAAPSNPPGLAANLGAALRGSTAATDRFGLAPFSLGGGGNAATVQEPVAVPTSVHLPPPPEWETGGAGAFVHTVWTEILAVVGAHVRALGGNAMVGFRVNHAGFHEAIKNQAYSLVCVSGDVCWVERGGAGAGGVGEGAAGGGAS